MSDSSAASSPDSFAPEQTLEKTAPITLKSGEVARLRARLRQAKAAEKQLRQAETRYRSLALATSLIVWGLCGESGFYELSHGWGNFTGQSLEETHNFGWINAVHPEDRERMQRVWAEAVERCENFEVEYRLRHVSGQYRRVVVRGVPILNGQKQVSEWVGTVTDIEDQRHAEEQLRENEQRLRFAFEAAELGLWDWDITTGVVHWNEGHFAIFGRSPDDAPIRLEHYEEQVEPQDWQRICHHIEESFQKDEPFRVEYAVRRHDNGQQIWIRSVGRVVLRDENGAATRMTGALLDISLQREAAEVLRRSSQEFEEMARAARRKAEEERGQLLQRLISAQEDERQRISSRLHDEFGQNLTAMLMGLGTLESDVKNGLSSDLQRKILSLKYLARQMLELSGDLARELRPAALDTLGLAAAVEQLVRDWELHNGVAADFAVIGAENSGPENSQNPIFFPQRVETALYRVVQESLTNIARHAAASSASVLLEQRGESLSLIIEDDGCGFDVKSVGALGRLGIVGMRERVEALGGTLDIESSGAGTTIFARIPLN